MKRYLSNAIILIICFFLYLSLPFTSFAAVLNVAPGEYQTIQAAIGAALDGDTVLVADGTYTGEGNKNLDFKGKAIIVRSENGASATIIDCEGEGRGFFSDCPI